jgi:predicted O-methyltransferase YrrM
MAAVEPASGESQLGRIAIRGTSDDGSHIVSAGRCPTGGHPLDRSGRSEHAQMTADEIKEILGNTPHMSLAKARQITQFIKKNDVKDILELGFAHGVSTCYMAGALEEKGGGSIVSIDLNLVRELRPNIEELIRRLGYNNIVSYYFEPTSYTWRLMKILEESPTPRFDLCYIDGPHNWFVDGFSFFLSDRLLREGGWIIFDDIDWTYDTSPTLSQTDMVTSMPVDERKTPQIRKVYELLVKTHPAYGDFMIRDDWAYARKTSMMEAAAPVRTRREIVYVTPYSLAKLLARKLYPPVQKAYGPMKSVISRGRNLARRVDPAE